MGRRERSKQRVRDGLYTSALSLFAEQGYEGTTIDQIAERADVARGTFFNYFQRKEDIVLAWADKRRKRLVAAMEQIPQGPHDDVTVLLERCMSILADFNESERDVVPAILTAWVKSGRPIFEEPYTAEIFADIIEAGRKRGDVAPDVDPARVGNILRDAYLGHLYRWSQAPEAHPPLRMELREIVRIILAGSLSYARRGWTAPGTDASRAVPRS
ncbi:TetR/AcrR family transcriptional regulator [Streptomyces sp. G44]|uniref:TetR/AcrR family transcriptional regulator n=1 Tax=Streptomyces sp. G44 TaxID=2807632 RepID=UPI001EF82955|nr:TetR/AcrR family transcriptional regulator [Streptomyces sp. G44]